MHERAQIRQAVVERLRGPGPAWRTAAQDRVYSSRQPPIPTAELPAINVFNSVEDVDARSKQSAPRELKRTYNLTIEAWVRSREPVDDLLDALALEIEAAMDGDFAPGAASWAVLSSTDFGITVGGDRPMGVVTMVYEVTYFSDPRLVAPTALFDVADVRTDVASLAPADEAHDTLTNLNQE